MFTFGRKQVGRLARMVRLVRLVRLGRLVRLVMRWVSSCPDSVRLLKWKSDNTASGQGSPRERSPVGCWISGSLFLDVPGTATEKVRTCGFRRNSSSLDKAPKIHDSVRLNSLESFFSDPPFDLFRNLGDVLLGHSWIKCVL